MKKEDQLKWTTERDRELYEIVMQGATVEEGLYAAADQMKSTFYALRNRWYSKPLKVLRGVQTAQDAPREEDDPNQCRLFEEPKNASEAIVAPLVDKSLARKYGLAGNIIEATQAYVNFLTDEASSIQQKLKKAEQTIKEWEIKFNALQRRYDELEGDHAYVARILNRAVVMHKDEELQEAGIVSTYKIEHGVVQLVGSGV